MIELIYFHAHIGYIRPLVLKAQLLAGAGLCEMKKFVIISEYVEICGTSCHLPCLEQYDKCVLVRDGCLVIVPRPCATCLFMLAWPPYLPNRVQWQRTVTCREIIRGMCVNNRLERERAHHLAGTHLPS